MDGEKMKAASNKKIERTDMLVRYLIKFFIRICIFVFVLVFYITNKELMYNLFTKPYAYGISAIHILWFIFMVMMIRHIFPTELLSMAVKKSKKEDYREKKDYSELELLRFVQRENSKAWVVMLIWLSFNAVFGALYLLKVVDSADLLMLSVFYFLCDYICILLFCPFQSFIMKNRCCVNCRIYDWGHFMMFTPMLFIKNFFSWSLFFTSLVVLIRWEMTYSKYPERFWYGANQNLQCENCKDKTCQIKNRIRRIDKK